MKKSHIYAQITAAIVAASLLAGSITACDSMSKSKKKSKTNSDVSDTEEETEDTKETDTKNSSDTSSGNKDDGSDKTSVTTSSANYTYGSSLLDTGNLTETGSGYEGTPATTDYNYGQALQMSILFYELQRSGDLPEQVRCNWRGDSCLNDGSDAGVDLTGGLYDAGDHVKFNLPMAYTSSVLGWSVYEDLDAYEQSGQLPYMLDTLRWVNDYLIKCHTEDEVFYYQVGNGGTDHSWWGPVEVINMDRPSYCVTASNPGSAVTAEAAASLAVASIVFEKSDPEYSKLCLEHAKSLYAFADKYKSDAGYTAADGFYNSWSGFYDELAWAGSWLYLATNEQSYLTSAETYFKQANAEYTWSMCWDDVHIGAAVMLAKITNNDTYKKAVETHLDYWSCGTASGERITYTPKGLAWLDSWGSLRYATTTAFVASVYAEWEGCPSDKSDIYWDFAVSQAQYALGSTGFSYQIGYGDNYPEHPHHRTSQGSYCDNMNEPGKARHTLYGALVGGPDANDGYTDEVSNYNTNEVACDYNAGFTGLMAKLYTHYYGETLKDFGAVEPIDTAEFYVEGSVNVSGADFVEMRTFVYNTTAWPARTAENLEYRYFMDLSEVYAEGKTVDNISITTNYMQNGSYNGIYAWDEDEHIYYVSVVFDSSLAPRGQSNYKSELQIRMANSGGSWDNSNDPSYASLDGSNNMSVALYENGNLVWGTEPGAAGATAGTVVTPGNANTNSDTGATGNGNNGSNGATGGASPSTGGNASNGNLSVSVKYDSCGASANSISGTIEITNSSSSTIAVSSLSLKYYLTNTTGKDIVFDCYHSAINGSGGSYTQLSSVTASFEKVSHDQADTCVVIDFGNSGDLGAGDKLTLSFALHYNDWSTFSSADDYSAQSIENIVIVSGGSVVYGTEP